MVTKSKLNSKSIALSAFFISTALLASCSSGGSSSSEEDNDLNNDIADTEQPTTEQPPAENNTGGDSSDVIGLWTLCNDQGGLRSDFEFAESTYINRVGVGTCNSFDSDDAVLENAGPYSIIGTTTSDSGLESLVMELTTETLNGFPVFESLIESRRRLVFTGTDDELLFSNDALEGQELNLELIIVPFVRVR